MFNFSRKMFMYLNDIFIIKLVDVRIIIVLAVRYSYIYSNTEYLCLTERVLYTLYHNNKTNLGTYTYKIYTVPTFLSLSIINL